MILLPHLILLIDLISQTITTNNFTKWFLILSLILFYMIVCVCLHIMPLFGSKLSSMRLKVLQGGRHLLKFCFYGILCQLAFYLVMNPMEWKFLPHNEGRIVLLLADFIFCCVHFYLFLLNACLRVILTCRSLGVLKRILIVLCLWVPLINLFLLRYLGKKARIEMDLEICRFENRKERDGKMLCATKYPLILLHGIGFRDLQYFNYWGRIPKELTRNGALVYYGHQEAWGTVEANALAIKATVEKVMEENHCDKVNLIAHSKGGLDARFLISGLHMEDHIASLTTISTPHRGSELLDLLNKLPDGIYHLISSFIDVNYKKLGDNAPDCYHASKQLSPAFCREFNEKYMDSPKVYYQSYASCVKSFLGDSLLSIPNLLMHCAGASQNDGLVTIESAKWGKFQKTFISTGRRGISHGDMIDLKREDYDGFDVIEAYVEIAREIKEMGL
ncbi:MAG: triacylglycerol lipase [Lachnospiraceae bacterium]|nr:triacylglycerol lipase [Lachnospiraceae bacterium]